MAAALAPGWLMLVVLACVVVCGVLVSPRLTVPVLVVALVLQGVVVRNLEVSAPDLASAVDSLDEIALVAAALRAGWLLLSGDRSWLVWRDWWWAFVFVAFGLASSATHWTGAKPALLGLALSCKFFGFLVLTLSVPWQEGDAKRLLAFAQIALPLLLVAGLVGHMFPDFTGRYFAAREGDTDYTRGGFTPFMVPFINPGLFGWAMAVLTLAAFSRAVGEGKLSSWLLIVLGAAGVLLSLRRRPLLGIPVAIGAALLQLTPRQRWIAVGAAGAVAVLVVLFGQGFIRITVADTLQNYIDPQSRDQTARGAMLAVSVVLARSAFPLGVGFGRFGGFAAQHYYSSIYDDYGLSRIYGLSPETSYYLTDTYWPHIWAEVGILGALALLFMLLSVWWRSRGVGLNSRLPPAIRLVGMFGALALIEGIVESLAGPVFEVSLQSLVIALPLGMALRLSKAYGTTSPGGQWRASPTSAQAGK
jgi:hypothetical protein